MFIVFFWCTRMNTDLNYSASIYYYSMYKSWEDFNFQICYFLQVFVRYVLLNIVPSSKSLY